jgi:hypothetical protein
MAVGSNRSRLFSVRLRIRNFAQVRRSAYVSRAGQIKRPLLTRAILPRRDAIVRATTAGMGRMSDVSEPWPIVDVSAWRIAGEETQGLQPHQWLSHKSRKRTWLFKPLRPERNRPLGEHVTERLASELAHVMGIPSARVDLAYRDGILGCIVEDVRWSKGSLQPGRVLLPEVVEDYDPEDPEHRGHNVVNIRLALERFAAPPGSRTPEGFAAFDVFTGYLIFDALIANRDRHDRNWAVILRPPGERGADALCGSFDHASSLGFNLSDEERQRRMTDGTVVNWARHGLARQFEHQRGQRNQTLVELARSAAALCGSDVRRYWLQAVLSVQSDVVRSILARAPGLSDVTRNFTREVIMINRNRLFNALG